MKAIGGYFELELNRKKEYYPDAVKVNSGRNAFEYIILANNYNKIYIPFFTCEVLLEPLKRNNVDFEFYHINSALEPVFDFEKIKDNEGFLYTNYFGVKDDYVLEISRKCKNLIIDNAQSFYSAPVKSVDTFYSPRKFFGLPDGGYLFCNTNLEVNLEFDTNSINRMSHLLKRVAFNAEDGYDDFKKNDKSISGESLKKMSTLTKALLINVDYEEVSKKRIENYNFINDSLQKNNQLQIAKPTLQVPMIYPLLIKDGNQIKNHLINKKIFVPTYWPNVIKWCTKNHFEYFLAENLVCLPIDQRYGRNQITYIVNLINKYIK